MALYQIKIIVICTFAIPISGFAQTISDSSSTDSELIRRLESQMSIDTPEDQGSTVRSGISANPDIGFVGDFQASYLSNADRNFNLYLNESELSVQSVVDPYVRADVFISFGRNPESGEYGVEVEEGYITTLSLPAHLQLKAGKFKSALGRVNTVHAHALPFIDMPDAFVNLFGEEGLNDEGLSLSWLLPNKIFYQEVVLQATNGLAESPAFSISSGNDLIYLAHLKNFWDLTENTSLELGLTGISGPNDSLFRTTISAADITIKRKPIQLNTYHSFTWQTEIFYSDREQSEDVAQRSLGLYSFISSQIAKRWFLTLRYDYAEHPDDHLIVDQSYSMTVGWYATEFQKIEIEGKTSDDGIQERYYSGWLRWIFVMGAHGAHQY